MIAAVLLLVAGVLHTAHGHDHDLSATGLGAPCAACQVHAPVAALPAPYGIAADPSPAANLGGGDAYAELSHRTPDGRLSRAPPALLAN